MNMCHETKFVTRCRRFFGEDLSLWENSTSENIKKVSLKNYFFTSRNVLASYLFIYLFMFYLIFAHFKRFLYLIFIWFNYLI